MREHALWNSNGMDSNDYPWPSPKPQPLPPLSPIPIAPFLVALLILVIATAGLITIHFIAYRFYSSFVDSNPTPDDREVDETDDHPQHTQRERGLEAKTLESIPVYAYTQRRGSLMVWPGSTQVECVVCLGEFEDGDAVRVLPNCCHMFHAKCIDAWFASRSTCPICRASAIDLEAATTVNTTLNTTVNTRG